MDEEQFAPYEQEPGACPFLALEDDHDRRSDVPDYRHRCFASPKPEPRAFPHQERYCLSRGFTDCPIFLDWAKRESASVVSGRRRGRSGVAAGAAAGSAAAAAASAPAIGDEAESEAGIVPGGSDASVDDDGEGVVPAFLAGRGRGSSRPELDAEPAPNPEDGLFGPTERHVARRSGVVTGTARANRSRPDWEPTVREERYPRIKQRSSISAGPVLGVIAIVVLAAIMFMFVPGLIPKASTASPTPSAQPTVTATPAVATPTPAPTPITYTIAPGDTLTKIALKFGVEVADLTAANPQIKDADAIHEGDILTIPVPGAGGASPSASANP